MHQYSTENGEWRVQLTGWKTKCASDSLSGVQSISGDICWSDRRAKKKKKKKSLSRGPVPQAAQSDRCLLLLFLSLWPCLLVWPLRELSRTLWFIGCLSRGKQERCERLIARSYNSDCVCLLCFSSAFFLSFFQLLLLPPFLFSLFT